LLTVEVREEDVQREATHGAIQRITDLGVLVCIDHFGSAASSMQQLTQLPISELKIDRSFVVDIASDPSKLAVARSIIELAHNLNVLGLAVGVETREAWAILESMGCDVMQGNMICKPLPRDEFESWLRTPAWSGRVR
jgi:EAL domain-containing protein (putative c-di-GMP-specific phosphodiesterase class I)